MWLILEIKKNNNFALKFFIFSNSKGASCLAPLTRSLFFLAGSGKTEKKGGEW